MNNCKNCDHAIYDPYWGDYKCDISKHTHIIPSTKNDCENWAERKGELRITAQKEHRTTYDEQ